MIDLPVKLMQGNHIKARIPVYNIASHTIDFLPEDTYTWRENLDSVYTRVKEYTLTTEEFDQPGYSVYESRVQVANYAYTVKVTVSVTHPETGKKMSWVTKFTSNGVF